MIVNISERERGEGEGGNNTSLVLLSPFLKKQSIKH